MRDRLREDWSPEQIVGTLEKQHADGSALRVSHETIYRTLFVESRGVLAWEVRAHRRSGRPMRRSGHHTTTSQRRSQRRGAVSIRDRPPEVADRAVPGHGEGDLLLGRHWTQLATFVERTTRFTVPVQRSGRDMHAVTVGVSGVMAALAEHGRRSLTWDRRMALAGQATVTANTGLDVYLADPHSLWQRGTNEHTGRALRQCFPKITRKKTHAGRADAGPGHTRRPREEDARRGYAGRAIRGPVASTRSVYPVVRITPSRRAWAVTGSVDGLFARVRAVVGGAPVETPHQRAVASPTDTAARLRPRCPGADHLAHRPPDRALTALDLVADARRATAGPNYFL